MIRTCGGEKKGCGHRRGGGGVWSQEGRGREEGLFC